MWLFNDLTAHRSIECHSVLVHCCSLYWAFIGLFSGINGRINICAPVTNKSKKDSRKLKRWNWCCSLLYDWGCAIKMLLLGSGTPPKELCRDRFLNCKACCFVNHFGLRKKKWKFKNAYCKLEKVEERKVKKKDKEIDDRGTTKWVIPSSIFFLHTHPSLVFSFPSVFPSVEFLWTSATVSTFLLARTQFCTARETDSRKKKKNREK